MSRIRISLVLFSLVVSFVVAGCKTSSPLASRDANATIASQIFSESASVQTVTFVSGAIESQPLALDQFLFAKHWTACATETGALASPPACTLAAEGTSYGHTNHWVATPATACAKCVDWTIPVAKAHLTSVDSIDVTDKTHATVAYTYAVVPNEFGTGFGEWTASHTVAWCGPDPALVGGWAAPRHGTAAFEKTAGGWGLAGPPATTFVGAFANVTAVAKPCAQ